jgi:ribosomal-protein-serine acetyltransferase
VNSAIVPLVELSNHHIAMRPYRDEDARLLFVAASESVDTVGRWMPWCHAGYAVDDSVVWVKRCQASWHSGEEYNFGLFDPAGRYVGGAGLNHFNRDHNIANLGYWVRQARQRKGFAGAAVQCLARFGFEALGLTRIEIVAAADNIASRRVAEKSGAEFECLARNRLVIGGVPMTAAVYSLIPASSA